MERCCKICLQNDNDGLPTTIIEYEWNKEKDDWVRKEKNNYTWDENANVTVNCVFRWDNDSAKWTNAGKQMYNYDEHYNKTNYTLLVWDDEWVEYVKHSYSNTYDGKGNLIYRTVNNWTKETDEWIESYRETLSYDEKENMTQCCDTLLTKDGEISGGNKYENTYDENSNCTWQITYKYDTTDEIWVGDQKEVNSYDDNGNVVECITYIWSAEENNWIELNISRITY